MINLNLSDPVVVVDVIHITMFHETVYLFIYLFILFVFQEKRHHHILVRNYTEYIASR